MFARVFTIGAMTLAVGCTTAPPVTARAGTSAAEWAAQCEDWDEWDKAGPAFQLGFHSYYVGTCGIAAILITDNEGHVLIDSGTSAGADIVARNIQSLGIELDEIEILLTSHEHFDHVGGMAKLKELTGARLLTSEQAATVFATGEVSADDPQFGTIEGIRPTTVDGIVQDGDTIELGKIRLKAVATPGHTHGALSWSWTERDQDVGLEFVYADSLSPISADGYRFSSDPAYVRAYREGLHRLAALDCTLLLTPHPSASGMRANILESGSFGPRRNACTDYAAAITTRLDGRLAQESENPQ